MKKIITNDEYLSEYDGMTLAEFIVELNKDYTSIAYAPDDDNNQLCVYITIDGKLATYIYERGAYPEDFGRELARIANNCIEPEEIGEKYFTVNSDGDYKLKNTISAKKAYAKCLNDFVNDSKKNWRDECYWDDEIDESTILIYSDN